MSAKQTGKRGSKPRAAALAETGAAGFAEASTAFDLEFDQAGVTRVETILEAVRRAGWLNGYLTEIGGQVDSALVDEARRRTGLTSNAALIEYALASVLLDDDFTEAFRRARGTVDPDIELGY